MSQCQYEWNPGKWPYAQRCKAEATTTVTVPEDGIQVSYEVCEEHELASQATIQAHLDLKCAKGSHQMFPSKTDGLKKCQWCGQVDEVVTNG